VETSPSVCDIRHDRGAGAAVMPTSEDQLSELGFRKAAKTKFIYRHSSLSRDYPFSSAKLAAGGFPGNPL
jgi:hypothetical protein